jgi:hypothetical protein
MRHEVARERPDRRMRGVLPTQSSKPLLACIPSVEGSSISL